jgi:glycosyltransferase involved in cell wall biosynthesis
LKILNITPHLGGGVGQVLRALLPELNSSQYLVTIASLEKINIESKRALEDAEIFYIDKVENDYFILADLIKAADIVLIHWWNHPALLTLLTRFQLPKSRYIFWSHISGMTAPNGFSKTWLKAPEEFVFTTPVSNLAPEAAALMQNNDIQFKSIWSTSGVEGLSSFSKAVEQRDLGFVYCGNLDFSKVSIEIFDIAKKLYDRVGERTRIIGPITKDFKDEMAKRNADEHIDATGFITEKEKIDLLSRSKVFVYPLAEQHYGTCDQTIQEALALGLPIVANKNLMEQQMLAGSGACLISENKDEFIQGCISLYLNKDQRMIASSKATRHSEKFFKLALCVEQFQDLFRDLYKKQKKILNLTVNSQSTTAEIFLDSLGFSRIKIEGAIRFKKHDAIEDLNPFMMKQNLYHENMWTSPTKSSPFHWLSFDPEDSFLNELCNEIRIQNIDEGL